MQSARCSRLFSSLTKSTKSTSVQRDAKPRNCLLQRHSTLESIGALMKNITQNGKANELANNATFVNTLQLARTTGFEYSRVSYYTEPSGRYLLLAEENDHQFPWISLRLPTDSHHDMPLLRASISELLEEHLETVGQRKEFVLDCDSEAMETVLSMLGNPKFVPDGDFAYFHMNDAQCAALIKKTYKLPPGFVQRRVDEQDFNVVIDTWNYCDSHALVKQRLTHLPSVGIYTEDGQLASFISTHTMGQMAHVYTLPEFRGKGLGTVAEMGLAQKYIRNGLRPHKCVAFNNGPVYAQSLRNPFYYEWARPDGRPHCWNYNRIEYR